MKIKKLINKLFKTEHDWQNLLNHKNSTQVWYDSYHRPYYFQECLKCGKLKRNYKYKIEADDVKAHFKAEKVMRKLEEPNAWV